MSNEIPADSATWFGVCDIKLCEKIAPEIEKPGGTAPKCEHIAWAPWGEWGQCDLKCGDDGRLQRHR